MRAGLKRASKELQLQAHSPSSGALPRRQDTFAQAQHCATATAELPLSSGRRQRTLAAGGAAGKRRSPLLLKTKVVPLLHVCSLKHVIGA